MKLTFGTVKQACAKVLNMNSSDPRVLDYANRGCERLLYDAGKSVDTVARYTVCLSSGCITWPRELETIEAWEQCGCAGTVRNGWYEFLGYGPGGMSAGNGYGDELVDRGNAVAFDDVIGTGKKLAVYADGTETAGAFLLVRYYDGNANKVYTAVGTEVIEGERVPIPAAGMYTLSLGQGAAGSLASQIMAGGLYEVIKPVTKKPIRLYEYDTVALTYRALAYYEPDETLPTYRRSLIPCLSGSSTGGCSTQRVTVMAKRRFIPATGDDSVLIISHADAVRLACQAIKKEEDIGIAEAEPLWQMAIRCLDRQLHHYQGDGVAAPINFAGMDCPVMNLI